MRGGAVLREAAEDHFGNRGRRGKSSYRRRDRNPRRTRGRKTIDPDGDGGKGNRDKAVGLAPFDRARITRSQRLVLTPAATVPDRADGMNHVPRRQAVASGDFGVAGRAAIQGAAFGQKLGSGRAMDGAIDAAAAAEQ